VFRYLLAQQALDCIPRYSQRLLGGPLPHWVQWGQEVLAVLCPLQVPEVRAARVVLKVLQILCHPENKGTLVTVTAWISFILYSARMHCTLHTLGPSGPGAPGWPCGPGFPGLPVSPCEPFIPGTPGVPGGPTDPGCPCYQKNQNISRCLSECGSSHSVWI
jgi:hypothetical protein